MSTPFADLNDFIALKRANSLALSPSGSELIATIAELNEKRTKWVNALWRIPLDSQGHPVRLTRGKEGDSLLGFSARGDVFFSSKRDTSDDAQPQLFMLPFAGGEPVVVAERHGGFSSVSADRSGKRIVMISDAVVGAESAEAEDAVIKARREHKVSGILHEGFPVRSWDHDIAPTRPQVFVADAVGLESEQLQFEQLTKFERDERVQDVATDDSGDVMIASVTRPLRGIAAQSVLVRIDCATGEATVLAADEEYDYFGAVVSADGTRVVSWKSARQNDNRPLTQRIVLIDISSGQETLLGEDFDEFPNDAVFSRDGEWVIATVDQRGAGAVMAYPVDGSSPRQLSDERLHFSAIQVHPEWPLGESSAIYALADSVATPAVPVRLDSNGLTSPLPSPLAEVALPGRVEEITAEAKDGTEIRAWLCVPSQSNATHPAPLAMFIHGGPWGSWNSWTWRWNPWVAVARGYAVLLPDPAISTGYGQSMIDRGWSHIGDAPFDDLLRLCDAAAGRDDINEQAQAALGGSYGGYMANWVAGHTGDRFKCIVTHASLYDNRSFRATTDAGDHWRSHLSDAHNQLASPDAFVGDITAPMLVIHGDKDYRVPIGQGLQLWSDLLHAQQAGRGENRNKFLYFPDENHWILSPGNSKLWYETVLAFLDHHVLGQEFVRPEHV